MFHSGTVVLAGSDSKIVRTDVKCFNVRGATPYGGCCFWGPKMQIAEHKKVTFLLLFFFGGGGGGGVGG